jgi:nucleoside-diphosphate-sugar epimerase
MKILIAGGAGYIGSALVPKLMERGYEVDVIDLFWFGDHLPEGTGIIEGDIFDIGEKDLKGYEQVIFLAGLSNDPMAEYSPSQNFVSNAAAPAYLAYIAKKSGVRRFVFAGSCSVYGYTVNELYDETSPANCGYPYGISKLQGENSIMQLVDDSFSAISLRQGTVCGYSPRMRLDLVINTMFKTAMVNGEITVNNPAIWRPILSIQDAVDAYTRAIEVDYEISGVFNVASGNYTVGELADVVMDIVNEKLGKQIKVNIKHIKDFRNYKVTVDKARNILSFKPKRSAEHIVMNLIDNLGAFKDFDNPNYYNIEVFKSLKGGGKK